MLEVLDAGLLTTVQDDGRPAAAHLGVPIGGACDRWGLAVANAVLDNDPSAPALEMTLRGGTFRAVADCLVGVGGAEMGGRIVETGEAVASGTGTLLRRGQTLAFDTPAEGAGVRTYLALAGGVDVPRVLGSASTCLVGGFGGIDGRPLRAGDLVRPTDTSTDAARVRRWPAAPALLGRTVRVVRGPHPDVLGDAAFERLLAGEWRVSARADRQGMRLDGDPLPLPPRPPLLSHGVVWGAVQLPPDGVPIVLLADHQTVGGYPVPTVVISADHPLLGQLGPGDPVQLVEVSHAAARDALVQRRHAMATAIAQAGGR